jgi:hypothetical protein
MGSNGLPTPTADHSGFASGHNLEAYDTVYDRDESSIVNIYEVKQEKSMCDPSWQQAVGYSLRSRLCR